MSNLLNQPDTYGNYYRAPVAVPNVYGNPYYRHRIQQPQYNAEQPELRSNTLSRRNGRPVDDDDIEERIRNVRNNDAIFR